MTFTQTLVRNPEDFLQKTGKKQKNPAMAGAALRSLLKHRVPGQLVIQLTDRCNARCPQCGMRVTEKFERTRLSGDAVRRIIDAAAEKGIQALSFTGGEPMLLLDELAEMISYAGKAGIPCIRTGTNGYFLAGSDDARFEQKIRRIARKLALTPLRNFWISVDSAIPSVHEKMRGFDGLVRGMERAIPIFHEYGIYPSANLGINRNLLPGTMQDVPLDEFYERFREGFREFYRLVTGLGFTIVNSCYPMSVDDGDGLVPVYGASAADRVIRFTRAEKSRIFRALFDTIPEFRSKIRIFSPRTSLYSLYRIYDGASPESAQPCRGGVDFFFIDSKDGNTYPCGYRGNENMGEFSGINMTGKAPDADCRACDWECFRDPSELFGPLVDGFSNPLALMKNICHDPGKFRLWIEDLRYYRACGLFDGRKAPDFKKMSAF